MNEHVQQWISAYYDGELPAGRRQRVEAHLRECSACQADLEQMRRLSTLLQAVPETAAQSSPAHFRARVQQRIANQQGQPTWQGILKNAWRLAPVGLIGMWAFAQAILLVAGLVMFTGVKNLIIPTGSSLGLTAGTFPGLASAFVWGELTRLFSWLEVFGPLLQLAYYELVVALIVSLFLWSWIASLWIYERRTTWITSKF